MTRDAVPPASGTAESLRLAVAAALDRAGMSLPDGAIRRFAAYGTLLRLWNARMNLTAITDDDGIAVRHIVDSLTLLPRLDREAGGRPRTIDVGTGAGLPGIPLAIARPGLPLLLLDSLAKRVGFLEAVLDELGRGPGEPGERVETCHGRAEDEARRRDLRESFDLAVARAVAPLPVLAELCLPFVRPGGCFVAMKGRAADEVAAAGPAFARLGGTLESAEPFLLPGTDQVRTLVVVRKTAPTPAAYPRKAGRPEKEPLA